MPTLNDLAREGARVRIDQLRSEINAIYRMFPRLKFVKKAAPILKGAAKVAAPIAASSRRRRSGWTPAKRRAVAKRMKAYWAKRKREA